jgi:hypothetical protein
MPSGGGLYTVNFGLIYHKNNKLFLMINDETIAEGIDTKASMHSLWLRATIDSTLMFSSIATCLQMKWVCVFSFVSF